MKKRLLAAVMSLCMIVSLLPVSALAYGEELRNTTPYFFLLKPGDYTIESNNGSDYYYLLRGGTVSEKAEEEGVDIHGEVIKGDISSYMDQWPTGSVPLPGNSEFEQTSSTPVDGGSTITFGENGNVTSFSITIGDKTYTQDTHSIRWEKLSYATTIKDPPTGDTSSARYHIDGVLYENTTVEKALSGVQFTKTVTNNKLPHNDSGDPMADERFEFVLEKENDSSFKPITIGYMEPKESGSGYKFIGATIPEDDKYLTPGHYVVKEVLSESQKVMWEEPMTTTTYGFTLNTDGSVVFDDSNKDFAFTNTAETFSLTYDDGVTSGSEADNMPDSEEDEYTYNQKIKVSFREPTRDGYKFLGWDSDGDNKVNYEAGADIQITEDVELVAVWKELEALSIKKSVALVDPETNQATAIQDNQPVYVGDTLQYTVTVTNSGAEAQYVIVYDTKFPMDTTGKGVTVNPSDNITWSYGSATISEMGKDQTVTFTYYDTVDAEDELVGYVENIANVYLGQQVSDYRKDTASTKVTVAKTYTLTYDANGGVFGIPGATDEGTIYAKEGLEPGEHTLSAYVKATDLGYIADGVKVILAGWTTEPPKEGEEGKVYRYKDTDIPEIEETVTIENQDVTVYAVWGYDEDQDGVADINEVIITPADITIYTGGTGYLGVTTNEEGDIVQTTESGLPQPGYHIDLPANIQTWLGNDDEGAAKNLATILKFTYSGTDGESGTDTTRKWGMSYAGIYALDENDQPIRYVYTLNSSDDGSGNKIPVRILYTDENGTPQEDDKIGMSQGAAHKTYFMTINPGKLDQKLIQATLTKGNESKTLNVFIGTGTLTIRSVVEEDPTTAIVNDADKVNSDGITAVAGNNVDYYVNDSQVEITNLGDVKLLVDQVSNDDSFNGQMAEDAIAHVVDEVEGITDATNLEHKMVYLDLVDTTNGNTVVKLGDGQAVDIYWPLPSGATAQENDTVHVVHYTDMNRESVETDLGDTVKEIIDGIVVQQNGQLYVKFSTSSFSPFVLVYEAKDTGGTDPGTEPDPGTDPNPGGGQDDSDPYLKFESNGGTKFDPIEADDSFHINVYDDDHYGSHIPTRPGYRFTGWYEDRNLTMRVDEDEELHVTGSKTVFAGWEETTVPSMLNGDDHYAYIQGYADGSVRPNANITRAQVATIFFRLLDEDVRDDYLTTYNTFPDVDEDYWANTAISTMASLGVINGRNSGLFDPDAYITRAEFAAICARFDDSGVDGITTFTDTVGHWAEDEISRAAALGWIQGYADGTFRPNQYITRAQAVTMINRVLCRLPETEDDLLTGMNTWTDCHVTDWFYLAIQEATNSHDFVAKDRVYESWTDLNRDPDWSRYE